MLDKSVREYFGKPKLAGMIGIEVELESNTPFPNIDTLLEYWGETRDGSLRGIHSNEYVFHKPLSIKRAFKAIDKLSYELEAAGTQVQDSVRCGVHIHINVLEMTFIKLWTFVTCYYILEEILTDFCGEGRSGNHFCLRAMDADIVLKQLTKGIQEDRISNNLIGEDMRYLALNFRALYQHGSLEFRAMRTPKDLNKIKLWIAAIAAIKENSLAYATPIKVVENFSRGGEHEFFRHILGESAENFKFDVDKLSRGVRIAQELSYSRREWK